MKKIETAESSILGKRGTSHEISFISAELVPICNMFLKPAKTFELLYK